MSDNKIPEIITPTEVEAKREQNIINEATRLMKIINESLSLSLTYPVQIKLDERNDSSEKLAKALILLLPKLNKYYTVDLSKFRGYYLIIKPK